MVCTWLKNQKVYDKILFEYLKKMAPQKNPSPGPPPLLCAARVLDSFLDLFWIFFLFFFVFFVVFLLLGRQKNPSPGLSFAPVFGFLFCFFSFFFFWGGKKNGIFFFKLFLEKKKIKKNIIRRKKI